MKGSGHRQCMVLFRSVFVVLAQICRTFCIGPLIPLRNVAPASFHFLWFMYSNISNTRKRVSSDIQTLRSRLKKRRTAEFF